MEMLTGAGKMNSSIDLAQAKSYIDAHLDQPISLDEIAYHVHLSRFHFLRLFRRHFQETPHQYLTRRRIEKAKELLANSHIPITEICFTVGFESLGSFSTLFHDVVGWSPSIYRARVFEQRRQPLKFIPHCLALMHGLQPSEESNFQEAQTEQMC